MPVKATDFRHLEPPPHPVDNRVRFPLRFLLAGMLMLAGLWVIGGSGLTLLLAEVSLPGYTLDEPGLTAPVSPAETQPPFALWCGLAAGLCWVISGWTLWRNQLYVPVMAGILALLLSLPLMLT